MIARFQNSLDNRWATMFGMLVALVLAFGLMVATAPGAHAFTRNESNFLAACGFKCGVANNQVKVDAGYAWCGTYYVNKRSSDAYVRNNAFWLANLSTEVYVAAGRDATRANAIGVTAHKFFCPRY